MANSGDPTVENRDIGPPGDENVLGVETASASNDLSDDEWWSASEGTSEPQTVTSTSLKRKSSGEDRGSTKKRQVTGVAQKPSEGMLQYDTTRYRLYDPQANIVGKQYIGAHASFRGYDDHMLFILPEVDISDVPTSGVRLDDNTVALAIENAAEKPDTRIGRPSSTWQA